MDSLQVRRAYKLRAYPTRAQETRAKGLLHDHCDLYNAALQERRDAWRMQQTRISYRDQSAQLKEIRADDPAGQGRHSFTAQQQTLRRLDAVFGAFYKRVKEPDQGKRKPKRRSGSKSERKIGCPRFKAVQRFNQVLFVAGDGAKWEPAGSGRWAYASFQAVGRLKVKQHRQVVGRIKTLQVKREHRRWFVIVVTETEAQPRVVPAITSESGGSSRANGGGSETSATTSTTRPPEPSLARTT
jgi:putative transposase